MNIKKRNREYGWKEKTIQQLKYKINNLENINKMLENKLLEVISHRDIIEKMNQTLIILLEIKDEK